MQQTEAVELAARQPSRRQSLAKRQQDISRPAADLEGMSGLRSEALHEPADHLVARLEPEVIILDGAEPVVAREGETFIDIVEVWRELDETVFRGVSETTGWATPACRP